VCVRFAGEAPVSSRHAALRVGVPPRRALLPLRLRRCAFAIDDVPPCDSCAVLWPLARHAASEGGAGLSAGDARKTVRFKQRKPRSGVLDSSGRTDGRRRLRPARTPPAPRISGACGAVRRVTSGPSVRAERRHATVGAYLGMDQTFRNLDAWRVCLAPQTCRRRHPG